MDHTTSYRNLSGRIPTSVPKHMQLKCMIIYLCRALNATLSFWSTHCLPQISNSSSPIISLNWWPWWPWFPLQWEHWGNQKTLNMTILTGICAHILHLHSYEQELLLANLSFYVLEPNPPTYPRISLNNSRPLQQSPSSVILLSTSCKSI